jgi:F-type H+-transporting ATPase subunit epsilon
MAALTSPAQTIALEIVTPTGVVLSADVEEVVAPSVHGEFGVLPGHLPMLAALQVGLVHYRQGGQMVDVAVGRGFAEVIQDKTLILTDRFIEKDDVKVLAVRERLEEVDARLDKWDGELDDPERLGLIEEEQWLAAQLELYGDPPVPKVLEHSAPLDYGAIMPEALLSDALSSDATSSERDAGDAPEDAT